jgi:CheY-like chemotaxis protein
VIDGVQFIQYVRQMEAFKDLPIIPISASVGEEEIRRCRDLGCEDFLSKPVDYRRLLDCLQSRLQLEWIEESMPEEIPSEDVAEATSPPLPANEAAQFADLARRGDLLNLMKAVDQFVATQPAYRPFLDRLRKLCERFRVRQIRELIDEHTPSS